MFDSNANKGANFRYVTLPSIDWKPPDLGIWYLRHIGSTSNVSVTIECETTRPPTSSPTRHPTMAPTRSHCNGIQVWNMTRLLPKDFPLNIVGWYRKQPYLINGKRWWQSEDGREAIKFFDGLWYFLRVDNPQLDTETMANRLLTNSSRWDDRPPYRANWTYPKYSSFAVELIVMCHATMQPSKSPTRAPTLPPTVNQPPKWTLCPNKPLFSFSKNESNQTVFWPIPQATDSQAITVELWQQVYTGIDLKDTLHKVSMNKATDSSDLTSNCTITIYVINGTVYNDSLDYCIHSSFSINVVINEDDYTLVNTDQQQYAVDNGITISKVYLPDLVAKRQNCYVRAQFVRQ
ncbi:hypothetical protein RFI_40057, partial [Reticulomyxa filosa]